MNRNIALSLAFAVFFGVELLSAQEIPREPEPQRQKAEGGSRTEMLRLVVRSAFRGAGDIPDSILESCFPPDKPRESHVSAALEVGNALLKEDSSELVYDNETGGRVPKRELSLRVLAGVIGVPQMQMQNLASCHCRRVMRSKDVQRRLPTALSSQAMSSGAASCCCRSTKPS